MMPPWVAVVRSQFATLWCRLTGASVGTRRITMLVSLHGRRLDLVVLQHEPPLLAGGLACEPGDRGDASRYRTVLAMIVEPDVVEADLAAGRLCCPGCDAPLARWGFAREREVRMLDGTRSIRPRRARCEPCDSTHVLLPAWAVPRRRDGAEVIGEALLCKAQGLGHRRISARLERPPATVRGWLRTFARRAELVASSASGSSC
jgi:hypothetical protein